MPACAPDAAGATRRMLKPWTPCKSAPSSAGARARPGCVSSCCCPRGSPRSARPGCGPRTWQSANVTPSSLEAFLRLYGEEIAALAVAAGLSEGDIQRHLQDEQPDRGALEMLADLNCFPYVTPASRPLSIA